MKYFNCPYEDYLCPLCMASGECISDDPKQYIACAEEMFKETNPEKEKE